MTFSFTDDEVAVVNCGWGGQQEPRPTPPEFAQATLSLQVDVLVWSAAEMTVQDVSKIEAQESNYLLSNFQHRYRQHASQWC